MKKLLSLALCVILTMLALTACGKEPVNAKVIEIELTSEEYAFGVDKQQPELLETVNRLMPELKAAEPLKEI
jgi:polar amino acid transport system substrate-binding protein